MPTVIKIDPNNARFHDDENKALIEKSLTELGAGRSILIDGEDYVIAGNGVMEAAKKQGIKVKVIETDGTELIAIKRTDLKYNDKKRKELAIVDNAATDKSSFIEDVFETEYFQEVDIKEWGVPEFNGNDTDYSSKNKEIDVDGFDDKMVISLEYIIEEYHQVKSELNKIAATPEKAVWQLLKL